MRHQPISGENNITTPAIISGVSEGLSSVSGQSLIIHELLERVGRRLSSDGDAYTRPRQQEFDLTFEGKGYRLVSSNGINAEERRLQELLKGKEFTISRTASNSGSVNGLGFVWAGQKSRSGQFAIVKFLNGSPEPLQIYRGEKLWEVADGKGALKISPSVTAHELLECISNPELQSPVKSPEVTEFIFDKKVYRCILSKQPNLEGRRLGELLRQSNVTIRQTLPLDGRCSALGLLWSGHEARVGMVAEIEFNQGVAKPFALYRGTTLWESRNAQGNLEISPTLSPHTLLEKLDIRKDDTLPPLTAQDEADVTFEGKTYRLRFSRTGQSKEEVRLSTLLKDQEVTIKRIITRTGLVKTLGLAWDAGSRRPGMTAVILFKQGRPNPMQIYRGEKLWEERDDGGGLKIASTVGIHDLLDFFQVEESRRNKPLIKDPDAADVTFEGKTYRCDVTSGLLKERARLGVLVSDVDIIITRASAPSGSMSMMGLEWQTSRSLENAVATVRFEKKTPIPLLLTIDGKTWEVGDGKGGLKRSDTVTAHDLLKALEVGPSDGTLSPDQVLVTFEGRQYRCDLKVGKKEMLLGEIFKDSSVTIEMITRRSGSLSFCGLAWQGGRERGHHRVQVYFDKGVGKLLTESELVEVDEEALKRGRAIPPKLQRRIIVVEHALSPWPEDRGSSPGFQEISALLAKGNVGVHARPTIPSQLSRLVLDPERSNRSGSLPVQDELRLLMHLLQKPNQWERIGSKFKEAAPYLAGYLTSRVGLLYAIEMVKEGKLPPFDDILSAMSGVGDFYVATAEFGDLFLEAGMKVPRVRDLDSALGMLAFSPNPEKIHAPVEKIPLPDKSVGFIECSSLHRLTHEARIQAVSEFIRVLKPGGGLMMRAENLLFEESLPDEIERAGIRTLELNARMSIDPRITQMYSKELEQKVEHALKTTHFYFGYRNDVPYQPIQQFRFVQPPSASEESEQLRICLRELLRANSDIHLMRASERFSFTVGGLSPVVISTERQAVVGMLKRYMKVLFTQEELGESVASASKKEGAAVMADRLYTLLDREVELLTSTAQEIQKGSVTEVLLDFIVPLKNAAERLNSALS